MWKTMMRSCGDSLLRTSLSLRKAIRGGELPVASVMFNGLLVVGDSQVQPELCFVAAPTNRNGNGAQRPRMPVSKKKWKEDQREAPTEYLPVATALALRKRLRDRKVSNAEIADFLNDAFETDGWSPKKVAKYLGGERRITTEEFLAICSKWNFSPSKLYLKGLEQQQHSFRASELAKKVTELTKPAGRQA